MKKPMEKLTKDFHASGVFFLKAIQEMNRSFRQTCPKFSVNGAWLGKKIQARSKVCFGNVSTFVDLWIWLEYFFPTFPTLSN